MLIPLLLAINVAWSAPDLTPAQRAWCERFARDAVTMTPEKMQRSASAARDAQLPLLADYLERVARGDGLETERALQASAHGPVVVIVKSFADIALGVRDRDDAWLTAFERRLDDFERSLPGYNASWEHDSTPRGAHAIANLVAHAGTGAQSTAPAVYLPFDNALRAVTGRSVIHWKNMTIANWYERELRPVADIVNAGTTSGESLSRWYALRFVVSDLGPKSLHGVSIRTILGDQWAPLAVATQDVTGVLAGVETAQTGMSALHDLPTFLAVEFHTLNDTIRGEAPPQHRPASCLVLNWCMRHGGLTASEGRWRIDRRAMLRSLRALTRELLEVEATGDTQRGAKLLADYGTITPAIQATLDRLPPPNAPKTEVHFAILEER